MTFSSHQQRVLDAIHHRRPDRTPRGELGIQAGLLDKLSQATGAGHLSGNERLLHCMRQLDFDLVHIHQFPMEQIRETDDGLPVFRSVLGDEHVITAESSQLVKPALADIDDVEHYQSPDPATCLTEQLDWFVKHSDLFVFVQVMGPVSSLDWMLGTEDYLVWCMTDTDAIRVLSEKVIDYEVSRARTFLDHGAGAIVVADDIAFNSGMFLPPRIMDQLAWPIYRTMIRRIKEHKDVPVFLHTDGDIRTALPNIVACGFDGLHSLQPSAGVDIAAVKRKFGDRLCLMGNMDLNHLMTFGTPEAVQAQARWLCETIGADGGFILSTCNILTNAVPVENALAMVAV